MGKLSVVLVVLNENVFERTINTLNFDNVNLVSIVVDNGNGKVLNRGEEKIPLVSFSDMQNLLDAGSNFIWLISGYQNSVNDIWKTKKFLMNCGVSEDNIVNFEILSHILVEWFANLRYVEKYGADFFVTGISYAEVGLDLRYISHARGRGVNLSGSNQDLLQGYLTAKHIFNHVPPGTIKFVLIGLAPFSFRYTNAEAFSVCPRNLQYMLAINAPPTTLHDRLLNILVKDDVKNFYCNITTQQADLNFDAVKNALNGEFPARAVITWEDELKNLTKKFRPQVVEKNIQILEDYIKLCLDNGAKPVGVVFPFAPAMWKNYDAELLESFRIIINRLEENYDFTCIDLFDLELGYDCFYNMAHLNLNGAAYSSIYLGLRLYDEKILSEENFVVMNYGYFEMLSQLLPKEDYNALMSRVFEKSVEMIRRKDKIKIGFVLYDSSMWCGDAIYNFFATDSRFEPTIFLCLRTDKFNDELVRKDFLHGVEQFKSRGLNVVALDEKNSDVLAQDVLIFLTPYFEVLPTAFQLSNLNARTLLIYVPYAFNATAFNIYNITIYHVGWQLFFDSQYHVNLLKQECRTGMPRGHYSGYPKMDFFYQTAHDFKFDWKMARPNAKKIIYAPHWSINTGVLYATFQWNFQFMYEFAKAHPETSWVFKPHPNLLFSAVSSGLFLSTKDFEEYLDAWNRLPNAKVVTGGYYQEIFATSDGMILDSGSFIAEYQFTHKPMIFLTRETQEFNDMGNGILNVSYLVDGHDLNGIAALMQKVFINGDDPKFVERRKFFDENLNYFNHNGMLASEFIYKSISQELTVT